MLVESYSRSRWLDKLRPAGTQRGGWVGGLDGTCRGHWLIPLLKKRLHFSIRACHPCASARADVEIFLRRHCRRRGKKTGKSSGQCTVEIPVQSTAREFHTSLPYHRTSPLANNFLNPAIHSSKLHTKKKTTCHLKGHAAQKKNTICALFVHAQASTQVSFMSSQATLHQGRVNLCIVQNLTSINTRLRKHPQPTSRMPHCVA